MSDEITNENTDTSEDASAAGQPETTEETVTEPQTVSQLPKWAQDKIKKLRDEAAGHRQAKNSAETETSERLNAEFAKEREQFQSDNEALLFRVSEKDLELNRLRAALSVGVSPEQAETFASRLQGETPEELAEDANRMKSMFGISGVRSDPSQGSRGAGTPSDELSNFILNKLPSSRR